MVQGIQSLGSDAYKLAGGDPVTQAQIWSKAIRSTEAVGQYASETIQDWSKPLRDIRDGVTSAYNALDNNRAIAAAQGQSAEFAGKVIGRSLFEVGTLDLGAVGKVGELSEATKLLGGAEKAADTIKNPAFRGGDEIVSSVKKCPEPSLASVETANTGNWRATSRTGKPKTILGRTTDGYIEKADELGANKFEIPQEQFEKMSEDERWNANKEFLDDVIDSGSDIELVTPWDSAEGYYFQREKDYLQSRGFSPSSDGYHLIRK